MIEPVQKKPLTQLGKTMPPTAPQPPTFDDLESFDDFDMNFDSIVGEDDAPDGASSAATAAVSAEKIVAAYSTLATSPKLQRGISRSTFYLDIETVPDASREHLFGLPPLPVAAPITPEEKLPSPVEFLDSIAKTLDDIEAGLKRVNPSDDWLDRLLDVEAVRPKPRKGVVDLIKQLRAARDVVANAGEERRKLLSVTPEYCRVAAIGWAIGSAAPEAALICDPSDEADALRKFWSLVKQHGPIVGYNVIGFDLTVLRVRSAILGVQPSISLAGLKPWDDSVVDLMVRRFGQGGKAMKLKDLARLYGIPVPAGDCDGSKVAELMRMDPAAVEAYVKSDIEVTRELHRIWTGYFAP